MKQTDLEMYTAMREAIYKLQTTLGHHEIQLRERDKENIRLRKRVERMEELSLQRGTRVGKLEEKNAMTERRYESLQQPLGKLTDDAKQLDMFASSTDHHLKRLERRVDFLEERKTWVGSTPECPTCKKYMHLKNNYMGGQFWGCTDWPKCWGSRDHPDTTKDRGRTIKPNWNQLPSVAHPNCRCDLAV